MTNAATITLTGTKSQIVNQSNVNALLGFTTNAAAGKFTLAGNQSLTTTAGSITNAGILTVMAGSTLTVGNGGNTSLAVNYTQTGATTTVDGTLTSSTSTTTPTLNLTGGSLFGGGTLGYVVDNTSGTITPGDSSTKTGALAITGNYAQNSTGVLDISIGGTTAGKQYDQVNVTGSTSSASLNGTLNLSLINGFVPTVGTTFDVVNASSVSGNFSTINGTSINSNEHFVVTVDGTDVDVTVVSGPASAVPVQASLVGPTYDIMKLGLLGFGPHGQVGRGTLTGSPRLSPRLSAMATLASPTIGQSLFGSQGQFGSSARTSSRTSVDFSANSTFTKAAPTGFGSQSSRALQGMTGSPSKLQTSPSAYLAVAALSAAKPASLDAVARQVAMNLSSTAALRTFRSSTPALAPHSFVRAQASEMAYRHTNPTAAASHGNNSLMGRKTLEYNLDVLSLLGISSRHLSGNRSSQPGSAGASNFGYLMLSGSH